MRNLVLYYLLVRRTRVCATPRPAPNELVLCCVKSSDTENLGATMAPYVGSDAALVEDLHCAGRAAKLIMVQLSMQMKILLRVALWAGLAATASVHAERLPVLGQIDLPHPYYYREMYLPQYVLQQLAQAKAVFVGLE